MGTAINLPYKHVYNISATISTVVYESVGKLTMSTPVSWQ